MPRVRGHYARRPRTWRSGRSPAIGTIVLIVLGLFLLAYLFMR